MPDADLLFVIHEKIAEMERLRLRIHNELGAPPNLAGIRMLQHRITVLQEQIEKLLPDWKVVLVDFTHGYGIVPCPEKQKQ